MDKSKIVLLFHTVRYLRLKQVYYRFYYALRNLFSPVKIDNVVQYTSHQLNWSIDIPTSNSYSNRVFTFLNIEHRFEQIDWNCADYGKLWTYNLNYFDFLNQDGISKEEGLGLIEDYIDSQSNLIDGLEPYPISLRIINWIKFISKHKIRDEKVDAILFKHVILLNRTLEYHLLGNHLLENAFALLLGAYYFKDDRIYKRAKNLLETELNEQILIDGAHFELSPMYHQIILSRLLDSIQLIKLNSKWQKDDLLSFLEAKASLMISWLHNITYKNGNIPMLNDATFNIAPNSKKIFSYAIHLGINNQNIPLSDSGYRKIKFYNYELLIDIGNIGPSYQPGHAHSDTFNFELIKEDNPVIVDTGISTYEKNAIRQYERATSSHNTVKIGSKDQTQVWGGFRVAKRAKITYLIEKPNLIEASHDGYLSDGYKHTRSFLWGEKYLILKDKINRSTSNNAKAYFHLHSSVTKPLVDGNNVILESSGVSIEFERASNISIEEYQLSAGFNKTNLAYKIVVLFDQKLKTKISL